MQPGDAERLDPQILEVLVKRRPVEFAQHIPRTFESIFKVIHDQKLLLRETGVNVLKQCLLVWRGRGLYPGIYRDIEVGFTTSKEEMVHGWLPVAVAEHCPAVEVSHPVCGVQGLQVRVPAL